MENEFLAQVLEEAIAQEEAAQRAAQEAHVRWTRLVYRLQRVFFLRRVWAHLGHHLREFAALRPRRQRRLQ